MTYIIRIPYPCCSPFTKSPSYFCPSCLNYIYIYIYIYIVCIPLPCIKPSLISPSYKSPLSNFNFPNVLSCFSLNIIIFLGVPLLAILDFSPFKCFISAII